MTDNEIIKALECCSMETECRSCPLYKLHSARCVSIACENSLDLITRQQAEIERLKSRNNFLEIEYKNQGNLFCERVEGAKSEAVKEFAERLKEKVDVVYSIKHLQDNIDNLVKEMVG